MERAKFCSTIMTWGRRSKRERERGGGRERQRERERGREREMVCMCDEVDHRHGAGKVLQYYHDMGQEK